MIHGRKKTLRTHRMLGTDSSEPWASAGRAPCVLALHGFGGTPSELRPVLAYMARCGFAVHAPLLPGHGSSPVDLQQTSFASVVDAARLEVARSLERYGRVVLCGFSFGSLVAMVLASEQPAGLVGLVILANALRLTFALELPLRGVARWGVRVPDWYLVKPWSADVRDRAAAKAIATYDRHPLRAVQEIPRAARLVTPCLERIRCPVLVLHGGKDRVCPVSNARLFARAVRSAPVEVRLFPRSAHVLACDVDRDEVAREIERFVRRVDLEGHGVEPPSRAASGSDTPRA